MNRVYLLASLMTVAAGSLCANPALNLTCNLTVTGVSVSSGVTGTNGCFQTSFINASAMDSLNWGASTMGSGQSGFGPAIYNNNLFDATVATRTATVNNDQIAVSTGGVGVTRVDDLAMFYEGPQTGWANADQTNIAYFPGHFNSASAAQTSPGGDALIADSSGAPLELSLLGQVSEPLLGIWFQIASLSGTNSLFVAEVQAFDKNGNPIGTYMLTEGGSYGSGGACNSLYALYPSTPVPCNDSPYVGFYDPQGRISSVYISVFNPGNFSTPIGFAIDALQIDEAPEPAIPLLIFGGLAAMALYYRKRHPRSA
jgi:hypothetical protein